MEQYYQLNFTIVKNIVDYKNIISYNIFMNQEKLKQLTQRERKFAKTKVALLNALLDELETKKLSDIKIKELAQKAEVSEPTFFNYFDSKQHMLVYFIQLWSIEMQILANEAKEEHQSYLDIIRTIFRKTNEEIVQHPQIMLEIISFHAKGDILPPHKMTDGEKWLFYPDVEGVETLEGMGLETLLPPLIENAIKNNELSQECDVELVFLHCSALFFGMALLLLHKDPKAFPSLFETQLDQLFKGLSC